MATISSPGLGSGLDVNGIVSKLVALERRPIELLQSQASKLQTQLSSFGLLQSYLSNLQSAAARLAQSSFWKESSASSSDAASVSASASSSAAAGSYAIQVTQLAQAHSLASKAYLDSTTSVGTGTLRIELGGWNDDQTVFTPKSGSTPVDVTIGPGEDSLESIRAKINAANAGVTATIVKDASGARLVVRSNLTGEQSSVRLTVTDDDGNSADANGLSALAYDPATATGQMTQTLAGRDAIAIVNGLQVQSSSNVLDGVVEGLKLTLSKTTASTVEVKVAPDTEAQKKAIDSFVSAYNDIAKYLADQTKYDATTKKGGALQGDRSAVMLQNQLRSLLRETSGASATYPRLSNLGLEVQSDGTLKVNSTKLDAALADPSEVAKAFSAVDEANPSNEGFAVKFRKFTALATGSEGMVTTRTQGLRDAIKRNNDQQERYEDRVALIEKRLLRQYTALDSSIGQLNGLASYVQQQMAALAKASGSK